MPEAGWTEPDEPDINARHLLLCREVVFDSNQPESPYTLRGMLTAIRMIKSFPSTTDEPVYLYVEYFGSAGYYEAWFDVEHLLYNGDGENDGEEPVGSYGPFDLKLFPEMFVHSRFYVLRRVPYPIAGIYEFRLRIAGIEEPLITQRLFVKV